MPTDPGWTEGRTWNFKELWKLTDLVPFWLFEGIWNRFCRTRTALDSKKTADGALTAGRQTLQGDQQPSILLLGSTAILRRNEAHGPHPVPVTILAITESTDMFSATFTTEIGRS